MKDDIYFNYLHIILKFAPEHDNKMKYLFIRRHYLFMLYLLKTWTLTLKKLLGLPLKYDPGKTDKSRLFNKMIIKIT